MFFLYYQSCSDLFVFLSCQHTFFVVLETIYEDRIKYVDRVKTVEKLVPQIVEREVYKNACMDEDGLKVFNTYIGVR